ncbi:MAG: type II secretion system F family protein [Candidatus Manganitrophus sp. SA1]|nr:type II secretion system F family protein [Candidatus Manganitrophus morganii]
MLQFHYTALDEGGQELKGSVEASDVRSAAVLLRRQGLFVIALSPPRPLQASSSISEGAALTPEGDSPDEGTEDIIGPLSRGVGWLRPIRDRDRIFFLQQAALMLRSGLTLLQCLEETIKTTSKPRFAAALARMSRAIQAGKSFSQSMAEEGGAFPPIVIKLIESAEASGEMDVVLDQLAVYLDRKAQVRANLLTSLTYPSVVLLVTIGVVTFLVVKVIPRFARFFATRQVTLPWSTQFLLDLAGFVNRYGLFIVAGLLLVFSSGVAAYMNPRGRPILDRGLLMLPIVGKLLKAGAMVHFGRTLSILLRSGVTLLESLQIVQGIIGNRAMAGCIERAAEQILGGRDLAAGLRHPVIPPLVPQVVAVGERTGALVHVLEELGQFYDRQLQSLTKQMSALIEPVLIIIIGGIVGFVYFAFFQALFRLSTGGR